VELERFEAEWGATDPMIGDACAMGCPGLSAKAQETRDRRLDKILAELRD